MKLIDAAHIVRSKNAGPFIMCLDVIFVDAERYELVKSSKALSADIISRLYHVPENDVDLTFYDNGLAIKASIPRQLAQGDIGDDDLYGCQQAWRLYDIEI